MAGSSGARVRMPSTRWQRWAGSDVPSKTFDQMLPEKNDNALKSDVPPKGLAGNDVAMAGKRQYLKTGKFAGRSFAQKMRNLM